MIEVIILTTLLILSLIVLFTLLTSITQKKLVTLISQKFKADEVLGISTQVSFFGLQSDGYAQLRGKGALILTQNNLSFLRAYPYKEYNIETANITQVVQSKSFLSKRHLRSLLIVRFTEQEMVNAIGFSINNINDWEESISALQRKI